MDEKIYQILKKHKLPLKKREELIKDLLPLFSVSKRTFDGCCMACKEWRYTNNGKGECMELGKYTDEGFFCKNFFEGEYVC